MHENEKGEIRAFLLVRLGKDSWIVDLLQGYELIVGRGKDADIRIDHPSVREKHTGMKWNGKHIELRIIDGAEDVLVNGEPVDLTSVVKPGDEVYVGEATVLVSVTLAPSNLGRRSLTHDEFTERVSDELARAARRMQSTSLVMLKVGSGDGSSVAHAALSSFRGGDIVGTYAHDEIEFLLPDTPFNIAKAVVKRLIESSGITVAAAGIAVSPDDTDSAERLIRAARDALATALAEGKDIAQPTPPVPIAATEPPIHSPTTKLVVEDITEAAKGDSPVLLTGEPNSGKRFFARLLHDRSSYANGPFVMLGCAGIVDPAAVTAAFGTEESDDSQCSAKKAAGGTLVLDEIGDLPRPGQKRLLALLEKEELKNTRLVSTTYRDLLALCGAEAFLEELYTRLAVVRIGIPALRMRAESIVPLAENFAAQFNAKSRVKLSTGAVERMRTYAWPGNVLELQNAMERAVALADGGEILAEHLPGGSADAISGKGLLRQHVGSVERDAIIKMLADNNYNQTHTAKQLGISRRALIYKMEKYGLKPLPAGTRKPDE
jgi:two-component system, NtrC family, response regulator AtoC